MIGEGVDDRSGRGDRHLMLIRSPATQQEDVRFRHAAPFHHGAVTMCNLHILHTTEAWPSSVQPPEAFHSGGRFSRKARTPSRMSPVVRAAAFARAALSPASLSGRPTISISSSR